MSPRPPRMTTLAFDLFERERGLVVAPAGCGKTQTIVDALTTHEGPPVLVLTHTNAGVGALRERLKKAGVPKTRFRLATIDGWAMRLVGAFPALSGLSLTGTGIDYPALRQAALRALQGNGLNASIRASYARLVVDEHQDCSVGQHDLVVALARRLPTTILGDPLQRIFDFRVGDLPDWTAVVERDFPVLTTFNTPWRWNNVGEAAFGRWVLDARVPLLADAPLDLSTAPMNVRWVRKGTDAASIGQVQRTATANVRPKIGEGILVIGDSKRRESRSDFARVNGGMTVVEPVDLGDMIDAATEIEAANGVSRLSKTLAFAKITMTGVDVSQIAARLESLKRGTARTPATAGETACLACVADDGFGKMAAVLESLSLDGCRTFRHQLHSALVQALKRAAARPGLSLQDAAVAVREQHRAMGRSLPTRAVGSTLLLKGLEAEHAVILDADAMNARHLYVALSRASKTVTVISASRILRPG